MLEFTPISPCNRQVPSSLQTREPVDDHIENSGFYAYNNNILYLLLWRAGFSYIMIIIIWQTFLSPLQGRFPLAVDFVQVTFHLLFHLVQQVLVKVGVENNSVIYLLMLWFVCFFFFLKFFKLGLNFSNWVAVFQTSLFVNNMYL